MQQPEAGPDLVGRTSARLLAAGVDRQERLAALHLLAILDASIDTSGRVRRPLDDLAGEFELTPLSVFRSLEHLERAGAVQRDGGYVLILGARPEGLGGMQLAGFLEDVHASFAGDRPSARRSGRISRSGAALVAAAAAVAAFTLAPGQATIDQPLALREAVTTTVEQNRDETPPERDRPIARIRPSTTIGSPTVAPPLDTAVVAAATPDDRCVPMSLIPDRVDCVIDDGLIVDGDDRLPQEAPGLPEQAPPPPTQELPPPASGVVGPIIPSVPTILDLPVAAPTEGVSRTFRF